MLAPGYAHSGETSFFIGWFHFSLITSNPARIYWRLHYHYVLVIVGIIGQKKIRQKATLPRLETLRRRHERRLVLSKTVGMLLLTKPTLTGLIKIYLAPRPTAAISSEGGYSKEV